MEQFYLQEISIAGIYFHWLVPLVFAGIIGGIVLKTALKSSGLIKSFCHNDLVTLATSLGACSLFLILFIRS